MATLGQYNIVQKLVLKDSTSDHLDFRQPQTSKSIIFNSKMFCATSFTFTGDTALFQAILNRHKDIARLLVAAGAQINIRNNNGYTPLNYACRNNDTETVRLLFSAGANICVNSEAPASRQSSTDLVIQTFNERANFSSVMARIVPAQRGTTELMQAAASGNNDQVRQFVLRGDDLNAQDCRGIMVKYVYWFGVLTTFCCEQVKQHCSMLL